MKCAYCTNSTTNIGWYHTNYHMIIWNIYMVTNLYYNKVKYYKVKYGARSLWGKYIDQDGMDLNTYNPTKLLKLLISIPCYCFVGITSSKGRINKIENSVEHQLSRNSLNNSNWKQWKTTIVNYDWQQLAAYSYQQIMNLNST